MLKKRVRVAASAVIQVEQLNHKSVFTHCNYGECRSLPAKFTLKSVTRARLVNKFVKIDILTNNLGKG